MSLQTTVTTTPALAEICARLTAQPRVGLDTEFLRERTYHARLCLVQLAAPDEAACVDPLALPQLAPLATLLAAPGTLKVMHASRQDLEVLYPLAGLTRPVFDTQIAAALAGFPAQVGYAGLVRGLLGRELAKSHTRTDWSRRPLSAAQIEYALDDVRYLLPVAAQLEERLGRLGRLAWLAQELAELGETRGFAIEPEEAWQRVRGLRGLDAGRERLARSLAAWRERRALEHDRPRGWILEDGALREIVLRVPRSAAQLAAISELPAGVVKHSGTELLACVAAADIPDPAPPAPGRPQSDPLRNALIRKLAGISQAVAAELELVPEVLATRRELELLADGRRDGAVLRGWRRGVLGERLLAAL
ncbi:MAG TPA: ribonuclease D [Steroidobacteraceae bacterium]|nr:ribonuclease D [Steroidobacteraceae bacterium]